MATNAFLPEGSVVSIGQGDAKTTLPATDIFDQIGEPKSASGPGGQTPIVDATHWQSTAAEKLAGLPDEGQFTMTCNYVPDDTGQVSARAARAARQLRNVRIEWSDGGSHTVNFTGFVIGWTLNPSQGDVVSLDISFEISGEMVIA